MTTLATLRDSVIRDLHDPQQATFTDDIVDDLINAGIVEVNRVYPKATIEEVVPQPGDPRMVAYAVTATNVFRVELFRDGNFSALIPANDDESSQGGWDLHGGLLTLPDALVDSTDESRDVIKVWGYSPRDLLTDDNQVTDLNSDAEWAVRAYCRWSAYQAMVADRVLFKQWQAASQNTDVTMPQLETLVQVYSREWDRARNHLRSLRRV